MEEQCGQDGGQGNTFSTGWAFTSTLSGRRGFLKQPIKSSECPCVFSAGCHWTRQFTHTGHRSNPAPAVKPAEASSNTEAVCVANQTNNANQRAIGEAPPPVKRFWCDVRLLDDVLLTQHDRNIFDSVPCFLLTPQQETENQTSSPSSSRGLISMEVHSDVDQSLQWQTSSVCRVSVRPSARLKAKQQPSSRPAGGQTETPRFFFSFTIILLSCS